MTNLPPASGQPGETRANTGYAGYGACHTQESFCGGGWGRVPSGRRRGSSPPCQRRVAGLRDRPATLGLRYGPDSYGRQQWGILHNGRKPDAATPREGWRPSGCKPLSLMVKPQLWVVVRVVGKEAPANYVPAAAVIRRARALSGIIGRKGLVGGWSRLP